MSKTVERMKYLISSEKQRRSINVIIHRFSLILYLLAGTQSQRWISLRAKELTKNSGSKEKYEKSVEQGD